MTLEEFEKLKSKNHTHIPLVREVLADLDTPLSAYLKLANAPYSYLFESVHGGEKWGRYSIIGLPCIKRIKISGKKITIENGYENSEILEVEDPLAWIEEYQQSFNVAEIDGLPKFTGGLVGYFGYETIRYIEPKLAGVEKPDILETPDILLMVSEEVVVFDNLSGKLYFIVLVDPDKTDAYEFGQKRLKSLERQLHQTVPTYHPSEKSVKVKEEDFVSGFTEAGYKEAVAKAKQYIVDGDVMQVVLSQRMSIPFSAEPLDLYRSLRSLNPSPYMYFLNLDDHHVVGSSPEILVRLEDDEVTVRPIAGTRPRGATETEDIALEKELLADPKELAEHLMLIDLGRNDAGRVSKIGTVELTDKMIVERYSHVMHIVSNVTGELKDKLSAMDVLRATFPAGTVSGAPKIRAMEIIDELEPVKRGIYSGAVGYLSWNGNMDTAIAIRTAVIKNKTLNIQAGAGIVYDSIPQSEWDETMNKGRAVFRAVAMAEAGLDGSHR
ncbi:MAG: anthranilate synthase component I [endosymbiont of Galathealinum brachiosum]|uniref:Anthranilate synthase component 1 n=1 Tax=endosymbiont of Galathealinum brachiosum TaxID=2200906 RepID=A0A370DDN2_9GAMM|nr:MAG: anthranilate synthase component I [endosymbiont of Galathealinum brachiosum]